MLDKLVSEEPPPLYFYKYRCGKCATELMFNNQAIFSSRRHFNDIFDSKIDLVKPTPTEVKKLIRMSSNKKTNEKLRSLIRKGKFTDFGNNFIKDCQSTFNNVIDGYFIYCVSANPKNILLWSHYADSHKGFCIEFKSKYLQAKKMIYQDKIPKLSILDFMKLQLGLMEKEAEEDFGKIIHDALHIKLNDWKYEDEYRIILANKEIKRGDIVNGGQLLKGYNIDWIESIIFGARMSENDRSEIKSNMPKTIRYKEAIENTDGVDIRECIT